jgi:uncharacterized membrane protein YoaK (UPF0700 family)
MFLSALAGYVDATGFIKLGGFFVSFMSGNSTRLAVGLADGSENAAIAASLIALFMVGVVIGSLAGNLAGDWRRPIVLALVAALLAISAGAAELGGGRLAIMCMTLSMGAENAVFEHDGEVRIGLTYMTGTLVKGGQRIAAALLGGDRWGWTPYLLHWLGLVAGATIGALAYPKLGIGGLWFVSGAMTLAAIIALKIGRAR